MINCRDKDTSGSNPPVFNPLEINKFRMDKDVQLQRDPKSPILEEERADFKGLKYYQPSPDFVVTAKIEKFSKMDTIKFRTSKEDITRFMLKYARLVFKYKDSSYTLLAFIPMKNGKAIEPPELFVPFYDATNGTETYSAGRYLDFDLTDKDYLTIDFNYAYNPYCAYTHKYSCARVPDENYLPFKVEAGEKIFKAE